MSRTRGSRRLYVDVAFPSWGRHATAVAVLRDGRAVPVTRQRLPLARVAYVRVASARAGYTVRPLGRPRGATVRLLPTRPQESAPAPGLSVAVQIGRATCARSLSLGARLTVDPAGGLARD